jgi:hypothetical protein
MSFGCHAANTENGDKVNLINLSRGGHRASNAKWSLGLWGYSGAALTIFDSKKIGLLMKGGRFTKPIGEIARY